MNFFKNVFRVLLILCICSFIVVLFGTFSQMNKIKMEKTNGTIIGLTDIYTEQRHKSHYYRIDFLTGQSPYYNYYRIGVLIEYEIDGIQYTGTADYGNTKLLDNLFHIGDEIDITYNVDNPKEMYITEMFVESRNSRYHIIELIFIGIVGMTSIYFYFFIILESDINKKYNNESRTGGLLLYHLKKFIKEGHQKEIEIKVNKVISIDYERERVIFLSSDNMFYVYETDFGEEFKVDELYHIKTNIFHEKMINIEYDDKKIKAILILNKKKIEFKKSDNA